MVWGRERVWFGAESSWSGAGKEYGLGQEMFMVWGRERVWFGAGKAHGLGQENTDEKLDTVL